MVSTWSRPSPRPSTSSSERSWVSTTTISFAILILWLFDSLVLIVSSSTRRVWPTRRFTLLYAVNDLLRIVFRSWATYLISPSRFSVVLISRVLGLDVSMSPLCSVDRHLVLLWTSVRISPVPWRIWIWLNWISVSAWTARERPSCWTSWRRIHSSWVIVVSSITGMQQPLPLSV